MEQEYFDEITVPAKNVYIRIYLNKNSREKKTHAHTQ